MQNSTASTNLSGGITVNFTNDGGSRDVQVDYIIVNGQTRQSEAQSYNTGLYATGRRGGGATCEGVRDSKRASGCGNPPETEAGEREEKGGRESALFLSQCATRGSS